MPYTLNAPSDAGITSRTEVRVEAGGRLAGLYTEPPVTVRQIFTEEHGTCALCVVGSAAGPLPGDDILFDLNIGDSARASLVSAGANIAQGKISQGRLDADGEHGEHAQRPATVRTNVRLGAGARLVADAAALVVTAGADVSTRLWIDLDVSASLLWRETLVLGRTDETAGRFEQVWNVLRGGAPLLRQRLDLRDPVLRNWAGMSRYYKVIRTELRVGNTVGSHETVVHSPTDVTQQLTDDASLRTTFEHPTAVSA